MQHGGTLGTVMTDKGDSGTFQKVNGVTTPGTDTGFPNNLGLDYFIVLFTAPTAGCTSVTAAMTGIAYFQQFDNLPY